MKRMQLIAAALCLIMIATVGAGVVAAQQPASSDKVKQFDVTLGDTVKGRLIVNTNTYQYVLTARGLAPDTEYRLICEGRSGVVATATTNANGGLHAQGRLNPAPDLRATTPAFFLGTGAQSGGDYPTIDGKRCTLSTGATKVYGWLLNPDGTGMAGQTVNFYSYLPDATVPMGTATTDGNGYFLSKEYRYSGGPSCVDWANLIGDCYIESTGEACPA